MTAPPVQRRDFLAALHNVLQPRGYVEVGVQTGASLVLAQCPALGIDPRPILQYPPPPTTRVAPMESDAFFAQPEQSQRDMGLPEHVDLAFVDGMHLWEFALRDLRNIEGYANPRTVVAFDDVLPRNRAEAVRTPLPGDWTGDVWKVAHVLRSSRPDLSLLLVDVQPTGLLLVRHADPARVGWPVVVDPPETLPDDVLTRAGALHPDAALAVVAAW